MHPAQYRQLIAGEIYKPADEQDPSVPTPHRTPRARGPPDDEPRKTVRAELVNVTEPLAVTLPEATRLSGFSRSELYRRASRGEIKFLKNNSRVLVDYQSLKATVAALPAAQLNIATV
jgi:hypothetical protein